MEYISSKNICLLIRDTLKLIDRRPMDHGSKTGYIMCKMLMAKGGYEQYELADFLLLATLHDIGVYKTGEVDSVKEFEFVNPMPHSIYGFLFMKYISPMPDKARMLLYHRTPCSELRKMDFEYKFETEVLMLAEAADRYFTAMGDSFDHTIFRRQEGSVYSAEVLDLLDAAVENDAIFMHLADESYQMELDDILQYMIFPNEEKKAYMEMLMYCIGFRSEEFLIDAVTSLSVAEELGRILEINAEDREKLYYGTLIHDIGMISVPKEIIEAPRKLSAEEFETVKHHVEKEERILLNRMSPEVVSIAVAHHERMDGSGYPKGLTSDDMNNLQYILQVADVVTGMTCKRSYRDPLTKEEIIEHLYAESDARRLRGKVINAFIENYDEIMKTVDVKSRETMAKYDRLRTAYIKVKDKLHNS